MDKVLARRLETLVAANDFQSADAVCAELIASDEGNAGLWHMRGGLAAAAQCWTDAETYYRRAIALAPGAGQPWLGLARAYAGMQERALSANAAEQALRRELGPDEAAIAHALVAEDEFARGEGVAAGERLAALVPHYRARCAPRDRGAVLAAFQGIICAMCAGDIAMVEDLHSLLYPHATAVGPMAIAPTETLEDWCRTNGALFELVEAARAIVLPATAEHGRDLCYTSGIVRRAVIPGGRYIPRFDFALAPDGTVLGDTGYMSLAATFNFLPHTYYAPGRLVAHHAPSKFVDIDDDVLFVSAPPDNNFGHWLIDFLPRLQGRDGCKIALPTPLKPKQRDTLALFGVGERDIIACAPDAQYRFRNLHVFCPGRSMPPNPRNVAFLRKHLWGERAETPRRGKRVLLARSSVGTRLIANQAELDAVLAAEGFIARDMADMTIAEQRELLADAELLLGAMGTNSLALYFAPPGCHTIGIIDDVELDTLVAQTCAMVGQSCEYLISKSARASNRAMHSRDLDFEVDCAALRERLRRFG